LVSLYSPDAHSARAAHIVRRLNPVVLLTPLGELELANALELRLFRKEANPTAIHTAQTMIQEHVQAGFFSLRGMPMTAYERARRMARRHSAQLGVRTLDILHVTCAILLRAERFLTFDERQRKLALAEGLKVG
jgi:predicted nucleic acid-binding protein